MSTCHIVPHEALPDLPVQVLALARAAFMQFPGISRPSAAKVGWYLDRPRMRRDLSLAVLCGDEMVCNAYVTLEQLRVGGQTLCAGIIDTVMTHPDYRRRGLARGLMAQALAGMARAGAEVCLLYTLPDSMQQHFYHSLGFRDVARAHCFVREQAEGRQDESVALAQMAHRAEYQAFTNTCYAHHDGYVPLDDALWRWRREGRPDLLPSETCVVQRAGQTVALGSYCAAPIIGADGRRVVVLTDLCWESSDAGRAGAVALLDGAPAGCELRVLAAEGDERRMALLLREGLTVQSGETAMLRPLTAAGERAIVQAGPLWYPLTESIIGV